MFGNKGGFDEDPVLSKRKGVSMKQPASYGMQFNSVDRDVKKEFFSNKQRSIMGEVGQSLIHQEPPTSKAPPSSQKYSTANIASAYQSAMQTS